MEHHNLKAMWFPSVMTSAMVFLKINVSFLERELVEYFSTPVESGPYHFKESN